MRISAAFMLMPLAALAAPTFFQQEIHTDPSSLPSALTALETVDRASLEASLASHISAGARSALSALSPGSSNTLIVRAAPTRDPEASIKGLKSDMSAVYASLHEALASENPGLRSAVDARASRWSFDATDVARLGKRTVVAEQTAGASETPSALDGVATVTPPPPSPEPSASAAKQEIPDALPETSVGRISVVTSSVSKTPDPRVVHTSSNGAVAGTALPVAAVRAGLAVLAVL